MAEVKFDPAAVLHIVNAYDADLAEFDPTGCTPRGVRVPSLAPADVAAIVAAFDHMFNALFAESFRNKYHANAEHEVPNLQVLKEGMPVPSYFANVGGESMFYRKALSIAGLRNLVREGPIIYRELQAKKFVSDPGQYGPNEGLGRMRRVTGNVVDLDSVVLRCTDMPTIRAINASNKHKGLPTYSTVEQFANSQEARDIAVTCATLALEAFIAAFHLSGAEAQARKVSPTQIPKPGEPITVASNNSDRGRWPIWRYINAGQNSYHANVPVLDDIVGALLKAPFHCARHYAFLHLRAAGGPVDLERFFEECVVDSCFNMKWKAIEEFGAALAHEGTIAHTLQHLQMRNQSVFTKLVTEDDEYHTLETREMIRLVRQTSPVGFDKEGHLRPITDGDVKRWMKNTACNV